MIHIFSKFEQQDGLFQHIGFIRCILAHPVRDYIFNANNANSIQQQQTICGDSAIEEGATHYLNSDIKIRVNNPG